MIEILPVFKNEGEPYGRWYSCVYGIKCSKLQPIKPASEVTPIFDDVQPVVDLAIHRLNIAMVERRDKRIEKAYKRQHPGVRECKRPNSI